MLLARLGMLKSVSLTAGRLASPQLAFSRNRL